MRRLAGLLLVFTLLVPALVGAAQPRHQDYARLLDDETVIREAGQAVLDRATYGIENLTEAAHGTAWQQVNASAQWSQRLDVAASLPLKNITPPPLLYDLQLPAEAIASSSTNVTENVVRLRAGDGTTSQLLLVQQNALEAVGQAREAADWYDQLEYDTTAFRAALDALFETVGEIPIQPAAQRSASSTQTGIQEPSLSLWPRTLWVGDCARLALSDPGNANAPVEASVFGETHRAALDDRGRALLKLCAPWQTGNYTLELAWSGEDRSWTLEVVRLPTEWFAVRLEERAGERVLLGRLLDGHRRSVPQAPVAWSTDHAAPGNATRGELTTDRRGGLALDAEGIIGSVDLAYAGNETHRPAEHTWIPTEEQRIDAMFDAVGAGRPEKPSTPWWLAGLLLGLMAIAATVEVRHTLAHPPHAIPADARARRPATAGDQPGQEEQATVEPRDPRPEEPEELREPAELGALRDQGEPEGQEALEGAQEEEQDEELTAPQPAPLDPPVEPAVEPAEIPERDDLTRQEHVLLQALTHLGHDATSLTVREMAGTLADLGAPEAEAWAAAHERATYGGDGERPEVPEPLVAWARARLPAGTEPTEGEPDA